MAPSRPRRTAVRRALLTICTAAAAAVGSVTFGPVLSAQPPTGVTGQTGMSGSPAAVAPTPAAPIPAAPIPAAPPPTAPTLARPTPATPSAPASAPIASPTDGRGASPGAPGATSTPISQLPRPGAPPVVVSPPQREPLRLTSITRRSLQARLDQLRERFGIPGISVAIRLPNGSTWLGVSGLANVKAGTPVTPSTSFAIASISKTFIAALVLALAEDGWIDLDAPVRRYLPGLKVSSKILVRQLLDHTSGLRDYFYHHAIDHLLLSEPDRRWDAKRAMRYVGKAYFKPGKGWHYSNTNYLVLGLLAEAVGKAPLAEQVRARFLGPLGIDDTWYQPGEVAPKDVAHGYRFASSGKDAPAIDLADGSPMMPFTSVVTAAGGAGGFAASAGDLVRWARALYGGDVLTMESLGTMLDTTATAKYKPTVPYGMGVQVLEIDKHRSFGHSGRLLGFRSAVRYLPVEGVSIAVMTNQSRVDPGVIVRALLKITLAAHHEPCRCLERH